MKITYFQLILYIIILSKINSGFLSYLETNNAQYSFEDILDGAKRVKNYTLINKKLPKIVGVSSSEESMVKFTYAMGLAILNIYEDKISEKIQMIYLEEPSTPYKCEIKVYKDDYIDAVKRIVNYCNKNGAAPAYVLFSSTKIGYIEYSFGFSKILDFYRTNNKQLPEYNYFSSSQIFDKEDPLDSDTGSGPISGVTFKAGINEKNNKKSYKEYIKTGGTCSYDANIKRTAASLISGKNTILEKARSIFYFVRDKIDYDKYENSIYYAKGTLKRGKGNCCDQSNLLVSLCRIVGIPARYSHGQGCRFKTGVYGHVWTQILIDDIWYAADPTSVQNYLGFINNWNIKNFYNLRQYAFLDF